jgi:carboxypeptidase Taq
MSAAWEKFLPRLQELADLYSAIALLHWDTAVAMPSEGAPSRARATATLEAMAHGVFTDPEVGRLIEALSEDDGLDELQRATVRVIGHD